MSGPDCEICGEHCVDCQCKKEFIKSFIKGFLGEKSDFEYKQMEWIKIKNKDNLPEEGELVLTYNPNQPITPYILDCIIDFPDGKIWARRKLDEKSQEVTHYLKIEPPKE